MWRPSDHSRARESSVAKARLDRAQQRDDDRIPQNASKTQAPANKRSPLVRDAVPNYRVHGKPNYWIELLPVTEAAASAAAPVTQAPATDGMTITVPQGLHFEPSLHGGHVPKTLVITAPGGQKLSVTTRGTVKGGDKLLARPYDGSLVNALEAFGKPDKYYEGRPSEATLLAMITPENCREDFHRPLHYFGNALHWAGRCDAPEAVVAKLLDVMIGTRPQQDPWHPLKATAFDSAETPLHEFAMHSTLEAAVAMVIAAYPAALKAKCDLDSDTTDQPATPNQVAQGREGRPARSSEEVKALLASAATADGLARIERLAAEARERAKAT